MMNIKSFAAAAVVAFSGGAFATSAPVTTPLVLTAGGLPGTSFGVLSGTANTNIFTFSLSQSSAVTSFISAFSVTGASPSTSSGYDITSIFFDSKEIVGFQFGIPSFFTSDAFTYGGDVASVGAHTITVNGSYTGNGAGFSGFVAFAPTAPVPEPETYALLLAGLGLVATIIRRKVKQA